MKLHTCPNCRTDKVWKTGLHNFRNRRIQRYRCKSCGRQFLGTNSLFLRHRFPDRIIIKALMLYYRYRLSCIEVAELLKTKVSYKTVWEWTRKFYERFKQFSRRFKLSYSRIWHVDETYTRVRGRWGYVFVVEDEFRNLIAMRISPVIFNFLVALEESKIYIQS